MSVLIDTNVLLRRTQPDHPHHFHAVESVARLLAAGETLCVTHQNIAEFCCVATRPIANNGMGFASSLALAEVERMEQFLMLLPDEPLVYAEWKRLVGRYGVTGVRVHDARLVAAMKIHRVPRILTFDLDDFLPFGIEVVHPADVLPEIQPDVQPGGGR